MNIPLISDIDKARHIAILDTSSVSFMYKLSQRCENVDYILQDYDLILIPEWVFLEISDSTISVNYLNHLIMQGYPIYRVVEKYYSDLMDGKEWDLFQIVSASSNLISQLKSYLRKYVVMDNPMQMSAYEEWIYKIYEEWPISGDVLNSKRRKKKNAGEVSITILAEILSWYHLDVDAITVYSQDYDAREYQMNAEELLKKVFKLIIPTPVSYKSNDVIICQLYRRGFISEEDIYEIRKNERKVSYVKRVDDSSIAYASELMNTKRFIEFIKDLDNDILF